jgi:hypothetical protein
MGTKIQVLLSFHLFQLVDLSIPPEHSMEYNDINMDVVDLVV